MSLMSKNDNILVRTADMGIHFHEQSRTIICSEKKKWTTKKIEGHMHVSIDAPIICKESLVAPRGSNWEAQED